MWIDRRIRLCVSLAASLSLGLGQDAQSQSRLKPDHAALVPSAEESQLYKAPEGTAEGVLQEMAGRAAVMFTGTVTAIRKPAEADPAGSTSASVVEVQFAVDRGLRGASSGSVYTMREWAGMWRDSPRFSVGQRLLMLLHAAGPAGLSSPVDGLDGAIPITATSSLADTFGAFAASTAESLAQEDAVDMRWLQAKTLRSPVVEDAPTASPGESFAGGLVNTSPLTASAASSPTTAGKPSTTFTLSRVLRLLMSLQETGNASH